MILLKGVCVRKGMFKNIYLKVVHWTVFPPLKGQKVLRLYRHSSLRLPL